MRQILVNVGIRIMGVGLDLTSITAKLNLIPTHVHQVGDKNKIGEKYEQDMWLFESTIGNKKSLDAHLKWMEQQLRPHYKYLLELKRIAKIDIFCSYTAEGEQGGFSLSPKSLSIFPELGIKLELSLIILNPK